MKQEDNFLKMVSGVVLPNITNAEESKRQAFKAEKRGGNMDLNFAPQTSFRNGDTILVLGDIKNIQKCFHI